MNTHFLIGAANSGAGKTTLTIGLLRILKDKGLKVQPFKCGPDYIDTKYHAVASGNEAVNLDVWFSSEKHMHDVYDYYSSQSDCCVTEGVMGLFDGYDKMKGSSASISAALHIPVILVINADSSAYSVAPMIYGFMKFRSDVKIAGVIFNMVSSESHFSFLKDACNDIGVECFGYIPKSGTISIPSRHLGLTIGKKDEMESYVHQTAELVKQHVDIDRIINKCTVANRHEDLSFKTERQSSLKIAIAHDEAFNFTYRENIENLRRIADVCYFSPLHDNNLPEADVLYLPGGYPELYAQQLQNNVAIKKQIKDFAEHDGKIFAECGGMIYLGKTLKFNDKIYEMSGVLPIDSTMDNAKLTLGYRSMIYKGQEYRGHEFHYSHTVNPDVIPSVATQYSARGKATSVPLYREGQVIAGYTHWYWGDKNFMDFWK